MRGVLFLGLMLMAGACFAQPQDIIYSHQQYFISEPVPPSVQMRMKGKSLPETAMISIDDLRYLTLPYYDFDGHIQIGEMICNKAIARDLLLIFCELFRLRYPIHSIRLVDDFDASDDASMAANNTSCFNYRNIKGTQQLSRHAFGMAVDVNPLQNPWVRANRVDPPLSKEYVDRNREFPHKIDKKDVCYRAFKAKGFKWGGEWGKSKDYHHFQK